MIDVENIVDNFEKAKKIKDNSLKKERDAERQKLIRNADDVEKFLVQTICPIFETIKNQIVEMGYPCEVDKTLRKIGSIKDCDKEYALEIKLKATQHQHPGTLLDKYLLYRGEYEDASIISELKTSLTVEPAKSQALPIASYTEESISSDIMKLLKNVFTVR